MLNQPKAVTMKAVSASFTSIFYDLIISHRGKPAVTNDLVSTLNQLSQKCCKGGNLLLAFFFLRPGGGPDV